MSPVCRFCSKIHIIKDQARQRLGLIFYVSHLKHEPMSIKGLASEFAFQIMQIHITKIAHTTISYRLISNTPANDGSDSS
jgi:hypothetical protein